MSDLEYDMANMAAASASANILNGAGQSKDNAGAKPYDFYQEATGCTNELFYRNGPTPEAVRRSDAMYVLQTVSRYLTEAYEAGCAATGAPAYARQIEEIAQLKKRLNAVPFDRSPDERARYEAQRIAEGGKL